MSEKTDDLTGTVEGAARDFFEKEKAAYEERTGEKVIYEPPVPLTRTPLERRVESGESEVDLTKLNKAELVAEAEKRGVDVVPDSMTKAQIIASIESTSQETESDGESDKSLEEQGDEEN